MKVHRWEDIRRKKLGAKQLEENARWVEREIIELNLRALRELTGKTQVEVAKAADMTQPETSRAERREDHLISTLKRYVEGLGGELEVFVRGLRRQAGQAEGRVARVRAGLVRVGAAFGALRASANSENVACWMRPLSRRKTPPWSYLLFLPHARAGRPPHRRQRRPQPVEPPDADPYVRWCGRGLKGLFPLSPNPDSRPVRVYRCEGRGQFDVRVLG